MSRRVEIDALRGLLLVIMAITHLPTRLRPYGDQPLGFVSAAEGFVFLSAFVASESYCQRLPARGLEYVRSRLWARALRVYAYHLSLLAFAFTLVAAFAAVTGRPSLRNLLTFYFDSPGTALVSGPLLIYQPPLLDILPMYIIFLALTPWLLELVQRQGWRVVGVCSVLAWAAAQLGARRALHDWFFSTIGIPIPVEAAGSFDLLAWQLLWTAGLWTGQRHARIGPRPASVPLITASALLALGFFVWRHRLGGLWLDLGPRWSWLDKWHLGALRLCNFAALAVLVSRAALPALGRLRLELLTLLGRGSLQAFTAHVLLCLLSLGLVVDDATPLSPGEEALVLSATFGSMLLAAWRASSRTGATAGARSR